MRDAAFCPCALDLVNIRAAYAAVIGLLEDADPDWALTQRVSAEVGMID